MKKSIFLLSYIFFCATAICFSNINEVPPEILTALSKGDGAVISSYLNDNVELSVENKNDIYSKQQATNIINDFFRKNTVDEFNLIHKGEKEAASFIIGTLKTNRGAFRIYILTRKNNNKDVIQQFRIEPSNE